mmetsp:Transcript_22709/g.33254  ORF Transcript_22709/g.33254 Transcript_22709/m.33254 type:complete len:277 (-) Transcript_22709:219-1049(-)|eukprot:CAMPEP_0197238260 /NCGR_PEP_ID=MMETSP1429-20130617/4789_1 /TAXON_ID=49237 /ORGANISM="Chaetoceros  sp., Strain UNC1202" /LENGTH=276 /DNA_ID=CAMNT_0042697375 /DNA_START=29 /DNA_END=859 /DNA_ORIENTATION=-
MKLIAILASLSPALAFVAQPSHKSQLRSALHAAQTNADTSRRSLLTNALTGLVSLTAFSQAQPAVAAEDTLTNVYFGVGCFWHIQHEFVEAERKLLNRSDKELTSKTGYAGGTGTDKEGRVCYHNFQGVADYGKYGHGEVVGMTIPENQIGNFAKEYFDLFTAKGERVDPGDKGGEYRSLLGLPGGMGNPCYADVEAAATAKGMSLVAGKGNDPDTFGTKKIFVYDTAKFPFYQAEVYHQFHNDFQSPAYGKKYNNLANEAFLEGRLKVTGCPDRV